MTTENRKSWLCQEENRLRRYQNQHRGLGFRKFLLPPVNDRKVNLVGRDNHIYKGSLARVREDQLPPEVDETSIDEEALYKEIMNMDFPPVPEQEPLGPSRRIGGEYTLTKRLILAPVQIECTEGLEETLILGRDGSIYRGTQKYPSKIELDKKLGGTKRPIQKITSTSSTRGYVEPSVVSLHSSDKPPLYGKISKSLVEFPKTEIVNVLALIKEKSMKVKNEGIADTTALDESTAKPEELETDSEIMKEMTSELEESSGAEETEETATEESDTETVKSDTDELAEEEEEEESTGTIETKEMAAEELDAGKLAQEDEFLGTGETKETAAEESDADKLVQEDDSLFTGETKETAAEESVREIIKSDADVSAKVERSLIADDTKDVSDT